MQSNIPVFDTIEITLDGATGRLQLNRPATRNAFNRQMMQDIIDGARWLNGRSDIKVVVFGGNGAGFCSGFDLNNFSPDASPEEVRSIVALGSELTDVVLHMRAITIAAVHGHCIGGGVVLAAACDFRYASEDATFLLPETALGIPLAWGGIPLLVRELGPLMATEFTLLCEFMPADRALRLGMLNDVVPRQMLEDRVGRSTETLLLRSSLVLEATKQQIMAARESLVSGANAFADAHLLYSGLRDGASQNARAAYLQSRKPAKAP